MPQYSVRRRVRRNYTRYITESKQLSFDVTKEIPDLTQFFKSDDEASDWYIQAEIICPPIVILVLCREVEVDEKEIEEK